MKITPFLLVTLALCIAVLVGGFFCSPSLFHHIVGISFALYFVALFIGVKKLSINFFGPSFCYNRQAGKKVALTFDDGPDSKVTPALLDLLKKMHVPATFFLIGERAELQPELVKRMANEGHIVGNHTYHHFWWTNFMGSKYLAAEIQRTAKIIEELTGQKSRYFRPPVGLTNNVVAKIVQQQGLICVGFSAGRYDQKAVSGSNLANRILDNLKDGDVIVLHDGDRQKPELLVDALKILLKGLEKAGYEVVSLEELMAIRR